MIVPYEPEHLLAIRHQRWQEGAQQTMEHAQALLHGYSAYTAINITTGRPLICAGICPIWTGRAFCWASFDYEARPVFAEAFLRMRKEIGQAPFKRLEMYVAPGFLEAWRFAEMLGFSVECTMEAGSPDGKDMFVFKRIKRGQVVRRLS